VPAETTAAAYVDKRWRAPRTSWGHPSFEGVWSTDDLRGVPMSRPAKLGMRETLTTEEFAGACEERREHGRLRRERRHVPAARVRNPDIRLRVVHRRSSRRPDAEADAARRGARRDRRVRGTYGPGPFDEFADFSLYDRCITRGVLGSLLPVIYGNGLRITQNPDSVRDHLRNGSRHAGDPTGRPRARRRRRAPNISATRAGIFDGDTLVIETTNFTDKTSLGVNGGGPPNSEQLKLTERFTRVDPQMIEYRATVDDPGAYVVPWTIRLMITSRPSYEVYEYSCHEGNGAVQHALSGERAYERQVADAKAKGLPPPARAVEHDQIRNGVPAEGQKVFNINAGE
jgi:hypothetical protein